MNKIKRVDQYLLENYPTIWNTKLVWILGVSFSVHLLFYIVGVFSIINVEQLHEGSINRWFFIDGIVFFNVIISLLLIVFWLISMFKNNAFQNFYPYKPRQLFGQFVQYVVIVFFVTTFFLSYRFGLKTIVSIYYPDEILYEEIQKTNEASIFFSDNLDNYTIDQRSYPSPFDEIICQEGGDNFLQSHPKYRWLNFEYQFYLRQERDKPIGVIQNPFAPGYTIFEKSDSVGGYVSFKNKRKYVPNLTDYAIDLTPSYFNFSRIFYKLSRKEQAKETSSIQYQKNTRINTFVYNLLRDKNSKTKIKRILDDFISIADKYHVKHNLDTESWLEMVFANKKKGFTIAHFIKPSNSRESHLIESESYVIERTSDFYLESSRMYNIFKNIEDVKSNKFLYSLHFYLWAAIALSLLIFVFKTSGLRSLLFSLISGAIIAIFVGLVVVVLGDILEEYAAIGTSILIEICLLTALPFLMKRNFKKTSAVVINISLLTFSIVLLFVYFLLVKAHKDLYGSLKYDFFRDIDHSWISITIMVATLIFIYFRCFTIKKWKGLPEG